MSGKREHCLTERRSFLREFSGKVTFPLSALLINNILSGGYDLHSSIRSIGTSTRIPGLINALDKPPSSSITLGAWLLLTLWVPWSTLLDYLSLFKTRIILRVLTRLKRNVIYYIAVVAADLCIYKIMWSIGIVAVFVVYYFYASEDSTTVSESFAIGMDVLLDWLFNRSFFPSVLLQSGEIADMFFVFFWAGFAPSVWLWLYVSALFVTRSILRSERVINWLRWFLDVEKNPFRSIGAVAAALAFIASIAIILISAEVSRIGAAT